MSSRLVYNSLPYDEHVPRGKAPTQQPQTSRPNQKGVRQNRGIRDTSGVIWGSSTIRLASLLSLVCLDEENGTVVLAVDFSLDNVNDAAKVQLVDVCRSMLLLFFDVCRPKSIRTAQISSMLVLLSFKASMASVNEARKTVRLLLLPPGHLIDIRSLTRAALLSASLVPQRTKKAARQSCHYFGEV